MPTSPIRRVETIVTGVAGGPWYIVGHFTADTGSVDDILIAWHVFVCGVTTSGAQGFPVGSTITTQGEVQVINPVDGAILEIQTAEPIVSTGSNTAERLPPANQWLIRWRTGNYVNRREVRGRTNIPCPFEGQATAAGEPEAASVAAFTARAVELIDREDCVFVVWSKKNGVWWAAQSASCWTRFSILRSRRD